MCQGIHAPPTPVASTANGVSPCAHLQGYLCPNEFIATQGPLPGTVGDFWRMIWETRACTIVMMTQCFEKGRVSMRSEHMQLSLFCFPTRDPPFLSPLQVRCHQYWPEGDKPISVFGDIVITKLTEDVLPDWTVRVLRIERVRMTAFESSSS